MRIVQLRSGRKREAQQDCNRLQPEPGLRTWSVNMCY